MIACVGELTFWSLSTLEHFSNGTIFKQSSPIYTNAMAACNDINIVPSHDVNLPTKLAPEHKQIRHYYRCVHLFGNNEHFVNLPRNIGDARQECAELWPKNWPSATSNNMIGSPTNKSNVTYGIRKTIPCRSISRGKRTTLPYVIFKHRHRSTPRNIEHFDCTEKIMMKIEPFSM